MSENLIEEFVDTKTMKALDTLLSSESEEETLDSSLLLSDFLGIGDSFKKITDKDSDGESKLISSFNKNLVLLIQKTWVEKSDEELKARVLYQLEEFCRQLVSKDYNQAYPLFFSIVDNVVYLMFGNQTKAKDFPEYALRIDPEFGIFWWYITSLPHEVCWSEMKSRIALLLGMFFLANY